MLERQMLPNANTGSHICLINYPPSHPSCFPFLPSTFPSNLPSCHFCSFPGILSFLSSHCPPQPTHPNVPPQLSDLTAADRWLPSSGMSSTVHPQCEVGYFKSYPASALMSKKSHPVLLMAVIWLQPTRLLGVCLYIA